jgi:hypothetical protein
MCAARLVVRKVESGGFNINSSFTDDPRGRRPSTTHTNVEALMMYRIHPGRESTSTPWHSYGYGSKDLCLDEIHGFLDTSAPIHRVPIGYQANDRSFHHVPDQFAHRWSIDLDGDGDPEDYCVGTVGADTRIVSNHSFFESFRTWEDSGFQMETAGYLSGGSKVWGQVNLNADNDESFMIRPGDAILPFFFFAHAHDGSLSLSGGLTMTRIVCNNTLSMSLGASSLTKFKHVGDVGFKVGEIHSITKKLVESAKKEAEKFRFLEEKKLPDTQQITKFVNLIQGKDIDSDVFGKVHEEVAEHFARSIGVRDFGSASHWDLLNVWTEMVSHDLGNRLTGESSGDRVARRLESQWFGTGSKSNDRATAAAMQLASMV